MRQYKLNEIRVKRENDKCSFDTTEHSIVTVSSRFLYPADKQNKRTLEQLQECAFLLCLDGQSSPRDDSSSSSSPGDDAPTCMDKSFCAYQLLTGGNSNYNSCNRWYDKFMNFVVSRDGICGALIEHSGSEGITVITFLHQLTQFVQSRVNVSGTQCSLSSTRVNEILHHLPFILDDSLLQSLEDAKKKLNKLVEDVDLQIVIFDLFGKEFIKKQNMSPDAFIQMSLQLTYYKVHGKLASSYESAGLRQFKHGRVDNIRSCTMQVLHWVRAMCNEIPDVTVSYSHKTSDMMNFIFFFFLSIKDSLKVDLFKQALAKQVEILKFVSTRCLFFIFFFLSSSSSAFLSLH